MLDIVKKCLKIIFQILTVILFGLILIAIYMKVQMIYTKQNYATLFGYTMFQVASGSMEPELHINDVILVKTKQKFKVNDIVSFVDKKAIVTHRVISIVGDSITVKGDANNTVDTPIDKSQIIGVVVNVYPELKVWQDVLSDPKILIVLFITLLLFDFAFSYKKKVQKKEEKSDKNDVKIVQINKPQKDIIESKDLLELTRKIDLKELNEIMEKENMQRLENSEKRDLYNTLVNLKKEDIAEFVLPKLKEKEKKDINYTLRLDLDKIQKEIAKKIK